MQEAGGEGNIKSSEISKLFLHADNIVVHMYNHIHAHMHTHTSIHTHTQIRARNDKQMKII